MEPKTLQVLLVDDDLNLLATMSDILKAKGFEPSQAQTAAAAQARSAQTDIDVALIDLHLEDMPGLELLRQLKSRSSSIECILLTGHATQGSAIDAINAGAYSYFQKPCDIDQLVLSIRRAGEKRAAEQALRASEERFRGLYENATIGIYRTTPDGRILMANPSLVRMLGFDSFEQLAQRNLAEKDYEPDYPRSQFVAAIERDGQIIGLETVWSRRDGSPIFIRESARLVRDAQGQSLYYDGTVEDITDRKRAEEKLADERTLLRTLIDYLPDLIYAKDLQGRKILSNMADVQASRGKTMEDVIGKTDFDTYPPELARDFWAADKAVMDSGTPMLNFEEPGLDSHGNPSSVLTSKLPLRDAQGNIVGLVGIGRDITGRKRLEAQREQERILLRTILDNFPNSIFVKDKNYKKIVVNPEHVRRVTARINPATPFSEEDLLGKTDFEVYPREIAEEYFLDDQKVIEGGQSVLNQEYLTVDSEGRAHWELVSRLPLRDANGQILGMVGIANDITDRKQAEAELQASRAAEKNFAERLTILSETTTELSKAENLEALCRRTVELGRERLDFDRLSIWFLSGDHTTMLGTFGVDTEGRITDERTDSFILGEDYPSRPVIQDQTPLLHRKDVQLALMGQPVGRGEHVTAGLWDGKSVIGYISVDNLLRQRPFSQRDCEIIRLYATAMGHLITLKRTEMELQASQAAERDFAGRLATLSEATTELSKAADLDSLCHKAVELGRERLDFDRLAIWFLTEDRTKMVGTFGVDIEGQITDERGKQFPIVPEFANLPMLQSQVPLLLQKDTPLSLIGQVVGQGMHVSAGLWDGKAIIGFLTLDNLLHHRPISDRDCEIIRLYASLLGHLISLKRTGQELRASEERYRMLAENMTDTIWLMDLNLKTTYISPSVFRLRGFTLEELNTVPLDRQMTPESFARLVKLYNIDMSPERLAQADLPISASFELEMYRKDGSSFWGANTFTLIRDPQGQPLAILGTARDITASRQALEALENSEKRFRALIENNTDAIVLVDPRGRVLYESPAYGRMSGRENRERLGRSSFEFVHPQDRPVLVGLLNELVQSPNRTAQATFRNRHQDGSWRWFETTATNLLGESAVQAVVINLHDITERKQAEENIHQRVTELEVLYETGLHISSLMEPREIGRKVIEVLSEKLSWRHASIRLFNPETERLELLVFNRPGLTARQLQAEMRRLNRAITKPGQGLSGWVIQHGQSLRSGNVNADPRYVLTFPDIQSGLYVPMQVGGRTIGVIGAESEQPDAFTEADQRLLTTLAAQAGIAMENARLLTKTLRQVEELGALADVSAALRTALTRSEIVAVILDQLMKGLLPADTACMAAYDPVTGENIIEAACGIWNKYIGQRTQSGEGLVGQVAETRQPFQSNDISHEKIAAQRNELKKLIEAVAGVPLLVQGQFIGSLWIGRKSRKKTHSPAPFNSDEMRLLGSVADMAANALQRASLHEQALKHAEELLAVNNMGRILAETLNLDQIYAKLDESVWQLMKDISLVAITLYDSDRKLLTCVRFNTDTGLVDAATLPPVPLEPPGQGTQSEAIHTRQPVIINNLRARLEQVSFKMDVGTDDGRITQSGLYVPMLAQGQVIGVIQTQSYSLNRFSPSDAGLLSLVANTAAADIQNARLFAETQKRLHNLAALHEIDVAISASVDIHVTLDILLEQTVSELNVDAAAVLLLNPLSRTLEYAASLGFRNHQVKGLRIPLGAGVAGQAALRRQIQSVSDLQEGLPLQDSLKPSINIYEGEGFMSHHAVPLSAKGQVQGVLEVFLRSPFQPADEWFTFLETLSRQAAIAVDNNSLYDNLQRSNTNIVLAYDATIQGWSQALELRDKETEGHARRVTEQTVQLAQQVGVPATELEHVRRGTLLHDIGKMGIPDAILLKPDKLTPDEWVIMRRHPTLAYEMLSSIAYLRPALDIPHYHHEKWDGTGYPDGLKGEQIPLYARIFAIVDVYDALTNDRPYRPAWTAARTIEYIRAESGKHFDPAIVEAFLNMLAREK